MQALPASLRLVRRGHLSITSRLFMRPDLNTRSGKRTSNAEHLALCCVAAHKVKTITANLCTLSGEGNHRRNAS